MDKTRIPSNIVSALRRLERAGDEHSVTTERLCDSAWLVADLLRQQFAEHVSALAGRHDEATAVTRTGISVDAHGVTIWLSGEQDCERIAPGGHPTRPSRWAALRLAGHVATGWLDEVADWLATRVAEDQAATATLDAAAERLQPDTDGV